MKKNLRLKSIALLALLAPFFSFSQKLKFVGIDGTTKQWKAETFPVNLKLNAGTKMDATLQAIDTVVILQLKGYGVGTSSVDKDGQLILSLDDGSSIAAKATSIQAIEYGQALPSYQHQYYLFQKDLEKLTKHDLQTVRKYSIGGFDDITVDAKNRSKLKEAGSILLQELKKQNKLPPKNVSFAPAFPGGKDVFLNFLQRNIKPVQSLPVNAEAKATVQFHVATNGMVKDIVMIQSAGALMDNEILRVLNRMPKWLPGFENEKAVEKTVVQTLRISRTTEAINVSFE
ncbi:MAG: energy transducer TonB [Gammaproteobacteria bacterium]|nr:MAG: energy transducer TonB [Gammaproteobacteria bacterium]